MVYVILEPAATLNTDLVKRLCLSGISAVFIAYSTEVLEGKAHVWVSYTACGEM